MLDKVIKRDGRVLPFDSDKIFTAITKASQAVGGSDDTVTADTVDYVLKLLSDRYENSDDIPTVEDIQNTIEWALIKRGHAKTAKEFIIYRHNRTMSRDMNAKLMDTIRDLTFKDSKDNDLKRENGNIDGNTAMGTMLKIGSETSKTFTLSYIMHPRFSKAHKEGYIHIHDMDFYPEGTLTCLQIPVDRLLKRGFSTGHGYLRSPNSIQTAAALTAIIIQANQNEQHGGQSVPLFDYYLAPYVAKSFAKNLILCLSIKYDGLAGLDRIKDEIHRYYENGKTAMSHGVLFNLVPWLKESFHVYDGVEKCVEKAYQMTDRDTYQAMEAFIHNMNTMHSRAGAQIPFSSINFGTDTTVEGRMVIENYLKALDAGLGHGETAIFPVSIFKTKAGVNLNPGDLNYDLFKLSIKVTSRRLFPNFSFLDAPYNAKYYNGTPDTEVGYMGCRTRVFGNAYDPSREIVPRRGNLSFTSINLPRLAIESHHNLDVFFAKLDEYLDLVYCQLLERMRYQGRKMVKNFPFLMGEGLWLDSEKLKPEDTLQEVIKHGSLSIGFIGLAEALKALTGSHHGESDYAQELGLKIVSRMRNFCDDRSKEMGINVALIATPAEGLSGRFVRLDKEKFGVIEGVTDRDYYTNSFHVPVYYECTPFFKIKREAPYHELTNGGHITYVEIDGDPLQNLDAVEEIIRYMAKTGIGYGSINHPVDRCPVCGYTGIINDTCPKCGRREFEGVPVETLKKLGCYCEEE